jgi:hypothetical protein
MDEKMLRHSTELLPPIVTLVFSQADVAEGGRPSVAGGPVTFFIYGSNPWKRH